MDLITDATSRLKSTGLDVVSGTRKTEKNGVLSDPSLLAFLPFLWRGAGAGAVLPGHLLKHRGPLPTTAVARKTNKQRETNSICGTAPTPSRTWSE